MAHSTSQRHDEDIDLDSLADLYPLAFALASASGFCSGLLLRRRESARLHRLANPARSPDPLVENASAQPQ